MLTTSTSPSLLLTPQLAALNSAAFSPQHTMYTTPISTPQPSAMSPEAFGNATTPGGRGDAPTPGGPGADAPPDLDMNDNLVDLTDETWGVILQHRLPNAESSTEWNPALASGYLLKRTGIQDSDPLHVMEISIVAWSVSNSNGGTGSQSTPFSRAGGADAVLRDVMTWWRGLGTLARAKGMKGGVVPWHVLASERATKGLAFLL
jgi:mediator of RNA polymerase II transcription subunit 13, fungi type